MGRRDSQLVRGIWYLHWSRYSYLYNSRTLARLVWFHVPLRLQASKEGVTRTDAERVLEEKKVFLDLIEGFEGV